MKLKRFIKFLSYILLAGAVIFTGILLYLHFTLKQPGGLDKLIPGGLERLRSEVAKATGAEVTFKEPKIDLFNGIQLRDLRLFLDRKDPKQKIDFTAANIQLDYSLWGLLNRRLDVSGVRLQKAQIKFSIHLPEGSAEGQNANEPEKEQISEPFNLKAFLENPPIAIALEELLVEDLIVSGELIKAGESSVSLNTQFKINKVSLATGFSAFNLYLNYEFELSPLTHAQNFVELRTSSLNPAKTPESQSRQAPQAQKSHNQPKPGSATRSELSIKLAALDLKTSGQLSLSKGGDELDLKFNQKSLDVLLKKIKVEANSAENRAAIAIDSLDAAGTLYVQSKPQITVLDENPEKLMAALLPTDAKGELNLGLTKVGLELTKAGEEPLSVQVARVKIKNKPILDSERQLRSTTVLVVSNLVTPLIKLPINLKVDTTVNLREDLGQIDSSTKLNLDDYVSLILTSKLKQQQKELGLSYQLSASAGQKLAALHPAAKILTQLGSFKVDVEGENRLTFPSARPWLQSISDGIDNVPIHAEQKIKVSQTEKPANKPLLLLDEPIDILVGAKYEGLKNIEANLQVNIPMLASPPHRLEGIQLALTPHLKDREIDFNLNLLTTGVSTPTLGDKALALPVSLTAIGQANIETFATDVSMNLEALDAVSLGFSINGTPTDKGVNSRQGLVMRVSQSLAGRLPIPGLELLKNAGDIEIKLSNQLNFEHEGGLEALKSNFNLKSLRAYNKTKTVISQLKPAQASEPFEFSLPKPIEITLEANLGANAAMNSKLEVVAGGLGDASMAMVEGLTTRFDVKVNSILSLEKIDVEARSHINRIIPKAKLKLPVELAPYLKDAGFETVLQLQNKKNLNLERLKVYLDEGRKTLGFSATGVASLDKSAQLSGLVRSNLPAKIPTKPDSSLAGTIRVPWELTSENARDVTLTGKLILKSISLNDGEKLKVTNFEGGIGFSEELEIIDMKSLKFAYLIDKNPFERVDFNRQQPMINQDDVFSIERIAYDGHEIGPFYGSALIEQNVLDLPKFDLSLFGGAVTGSFFIDLLPERMRIGILSRLTGLNPRLMITDPKLRQQKEDSRLSARTALEYRVLSSLPTGRIDVTEIGADQLLTMIDVLDPRYEDDQMNAARFALRLGHPSYVGIKLEQGLMDMEIRLSAGIDQSIEIRRVPVGALLNSKTEVVTQKIKEVPLQ